MFIYIIPYVSCNKICHALLTIPLTLNKTKMCNSKPTFLDKKNAFFSDASFFFYACLCLAATRHCVAHVRRLRSVWGAKHFLKNERFLKNIPNNIYIFYIFLGYYN